LKLLRVLELTCLYIESHPLGNTVPDEWECDRKRDLALVQTREGNASEQRMFNEGK